jgi:hypothetical protein
MAGQPLSKKQAGLVRGILSATVPVRFRPLGAEESSELIIVNIPIKTYLRRLVQKLYPVLLQGGIRLTGSCAGQVALAHRPRQIGDIDICILVSEEVDWNQVYYHEQQILKELAAEAHPGKEMTAELLDTVRVTNDVDAWTLFSFGSLGAGGRHLDIRVSQKVSRSFIFSYDSLEVVIDPTVVKGMEKFGMQIFSRWGDYTEALGDLKAKRLTMPDPEKVRHGLVRYCLALGRGFKVGDDEQRRTLERNLVEHFLGEFRSASSARTLLERTAIRHSPELGSEQLRKNLTEVIVRNVADIL